MIGLSRANAFEGAGLAVQRCNAGEAFDPLRAECVRGAVGGGDFSTLRLSGRAFAAGVLQEGPRGREGWVFPHLLEVEFGRSVASRHYFGADLGLSGELWTFPRTGSPQLLQVGARREDLQPYVDRMHPAVSPLTGLCFSDTFYIDRSGARRLRFYFAPRGETTDGPISFLRRPTALLNPDAPIGGMGGQESASTVFGSSIGLPGRLRLEASVFHGELPRPTRVDLGLGTLDSVGVRLIHELSDSLVVMGSAAAVSNPEPYVERRLRFGASVHQSAILGSGLQLQNALIYGGVTDRDETTIHHSLTEEFLLGSDGPSLWGRIEAVQRTPEELRIEGPFPREKPYWVGVATLGFSMVLQRFGEGLQLGAGASLTRNGVPGDFVAAYGENPWAGRIFLQLVGSKRWDGR